MEPKIIQHGISVVVTVPHSPFILLTEEVWCMPTTPYHQTGNAVGGWPVDPVTLYSISEQDDHVAHLLSRGTEGGTSLVV